MSDQELFDPSDVTWEIEDSKRRNQVKIIFTCAEGTMNVMKTYLAICMLKEKIELQLNILDEAEGEH